MLGSECKCIQECKSSPFRRVIGHQLRETLPRGVNRVVGNDRVTVTISEYGEKIWSR